MLMWKNKYAKGKLCNAKKGNMDNYQVYLSARVRWFKSFEQEFCQFKPLFYVWRLIYALFHVSLMVYNSS
jgi:hypothetical protein